MSGENAALIPYEQVATMADVVAKSGLFGISRPDQALALMLVAQAEGLHPVTAARDYHVIQGRPTLKADTMMARFIADGGRVQWTEYSDQKVTAIFEHPKTGKITVSWDIARAAQAKLSQKDLWKQYPRNMMRARVISEGVKTMAPWVAQGMLSREEAEDLPTVPEIVEPAAAGLDPNMNINDVKPAKSRKKQAAAPAEPAAPAETAPDQHAQDQIDQPDNAPQIVVPDDAVNLDLF